MANPYCEILGIDVPRLDQVVGRRLVTGERQTVFGLLIVALLERGGPMTLDEVARRLEEAGMGPAESVLRSLKRSRPGRPPVYRDGDEYGLDPHSDELDLLAFVYGLRPPRARVPPPAPAVARPPPDRVLAIEELDEGWREASLLTWSQQRIVLAVLEAHGEPMRPEDVVAFVEARAMASPLKTSTVAFERRSSAVRVRADGRWESVAGRKDMIAVREAVRDRVEIARRYARPDPAVWEENQRAADRRRAEHAAELSGLRRGILHAFPATQPVAAVLVDVGARRLSTFIGDELGAIRRVLAAYDVIAGLEIRAQLRALGLDPGVRRLADLSPPQKSMTIDDSGRVIRLSTALLVQGSCGIRRPFGSSEELEGYLASGRMTRFRRRLEADARSLLALYEYGRTHGAVRVRWGYVDEMLPVTWVHWDEYVLRDVVRKASALDVEIIAVVGSAAGWDAPWARARRLRVVPGQTKYDWVLVGEDALTVDDRDVQLARLAATIH